MRCFRAQCVGSNRVMEIIRRDAHDFLTQQALFQQSICCITAPRVGAESPDVRIIHAQGRCWKILPVPSCVIKKRDRGSFRMLSSLHWPLGWGRTICGMLVLHCFMLTRLNMSVICQRKGTLFLKWGWCGCLWMCRTPFPSANVWDSPPPSRLAGLSIGQPGSEPRSSGS